MTNIEALKKYVSMIRAMHPEIKNEDLERNGAIIYANGNDGTDFDWGVNDRLCEFMVYFREDGPHKGLGFIKVFVKKNNTMKAYVYADGGIHPTDEILPVLLDNPACELAALMYCAADQKKIWDEDIEKLDLSVTVPWNIVDMFQRENFDDEDD